jgi:MFS family permease
MALATAMQRRVQCLLLSGQSLCNYVPRLGLPYIVPCVASVDRQRLRQRLRAALLPPALTSSRGRCARRFIVADMGYSAAQAASLLGAFFPGYVLTQIPLGFLAQVWGAKNVLTLNLAGSAAMLCALPAAVGAGPAGVFACLFTLGLFQGPFVPAQSMMKRSWVPEGPEKPMMLLLVGLGSKMSRMVSAAVTPVLCAALGWRRATTVYAIFVAAFTAFWQAVAKDTPALAPEPAAARNSEQAATPAAEAEAEAKTEEEAKKKKKKKAFEPRVFGVAGIQAVMWSHVAANNTEYCLMQWAPSYFNEVSCSMSMSLRIA